MLPRIRWRSCRCIEESEGAGKTRRGYVEPVLRSGAQKISGARPTLQEGLLAVIHHGKRSHAAQLHHFAINAWPDCGSKISGTMQTGHERGDIVDVDYARLAERQVLVSVDR